MASSGLFGLLGDAPLQIVDLADAVKIDAMYKLAQDCDFARPFNSGQDLFPTDDMHELRMRQLIDYAASQILGLTTSLRLAIAFRWCPLMCPGPFAPRNVEENVSPNDFTKPGRKVANLTVNGPDDDRPRRDQKNTVLENVIITHP
jgi:hypothetical protein